jgi:hypothetical protein
MHLSQGICWALIALVISAGDLSADDKEIEQLIDQLVNVSEPGFGYSEYITGSQFLPYEETGHITMLILLREARPARSDVLRKIVERGVEAVPALLKHIGDNREIKMKPVGGCEFKDEYDFNRRTRKTAPQGVNRDDPSHMHPHAVTVGDLCFVALGQMVNRNFSAIRYQPTQIVVVSSPTHSETLRKGILEDWSGLTKEQHKNLLIDDFVNPDSEYRRIGAYLRLAYYYPEAVEPLVLKQLAEPRYDFGEVHGFIYEKLYRTKDAAERKALFDALIAKRGEVTRQAILLHLFRDLPTQESDEQGGLFPPLKEKYDARACLVELYGYPQEVKSKDRPPLFPVSDLTQASFIEALTHDQSRGVGNAVQKLFLEVHLDSAMGPACLTCLASRGYGPFLVEQLNKIDVADPNENPLHREYIEAVAKSRAPEVQGKLLEIVKTTANYDYFMAALAAIDRPNDQLTLERARDLLAKLPEDTSQGLGLLQMIGERFPDEARSIYKSFLATGSVSRAATMCCVLWYNNPMSVEVLAPLLDDKRLVPGFSDSTRVCDRAAQAISNTSEKIRFDSEWSTEKKDQQIEKLKQYCRERTK